MILKHIRLPALNNLSTVSELLELCLTSRQSTKQKMHWVGIKIKNSIYKIKQFLILRLSFALPTYLYLLVWLLRHLKCMVISRKKRLNSWILVLLNNRRDKMFSVHISWPRWFLKHLLRLKDEIFTSFLNIV
jgi:hypothetical protein